MVGGSARSGAPLLGESASATAGIASPSPSAGRLGTPSTAGEGEGWPPADGRGWWNGLLTIFARSGGRNSGVSPAGLTGAAGAGAAGLASAGDDASGRPWAFSKGQISPGCGGDSRVRGGACHAGWRQMAPDSMPRWRPVGRAAPAWPPNIACSAPPSPSAVGLRPLSASSCCASASGGAASPALRRRASNWRHVRPNTIGAAHSSTPSISRKAPDHPSMCVNSDARPRPAAPPALPCASWPAVRASSEALAHSAANVASHTRTVPGPFRPRSPAITRVMYRHTNGNSHMEEMPNQPSPIVEMPSSRSRTRL